MLHQCWYYQLPTDKIISNHYFWVSVLGQSKERVEKLSKFWLWLRLTQWLCWYIMDCITLWWPGADLSNNRIACLVHRCTLRWNYRFFSWIMQKMYRLRVLTLWNRVVLEAVTVSQLINMFSIFYGTQRFICCLQEVTSGLYLEPDESSPSFLSCFLNISVNIILPSMPGFSKQYQVFPPKICMHFSQYACDMAFPSHRPWLDHSYNIWWGEQVMELLITHFYPIYCYFFSVTSRYVPQRLVLEHPHSMFIPHYVALCFIPTQYNRQKVWPPVLSPSLHNTLLIIFAPDLQRLLAFHVPNLVSLFCHICCSRGSVQDPV